MSDTQKYHHLIFKNFIAGVAWGVGSVIGATIVIALIISVLQTIDFVPIVGNFAAQIVEEVQLRKDLSE